MSNSSNSLETTIIKDKSKSINTSNNKYSVVTIIGIVCGGIGLVVLFAFIIKKYNKKTIEKDIIQFENETYENVSLNDIIKCNKERMYLQPISPSNKSLSLSEDYNNPINENNSVYSSIESSSIIY